MKKEEAENIIMNWMLDVFTEDQNKQGSYSRRLLARSLLHVIETEIGMSPPIAFFKGITLDEDESLAFPDFNSSMWED